MKKLTMVLVCACFMMSSAFGQSTQDSLSILFNMVKQLQSQQVAMEQLRMQRQKDSMKIAELQAQIDKVGGEQLTNAQSTRDAMLSIEVQRRKDAQQMMALQDSINQSRARLSTAIATIGTYQKKLQEMESKQKQFSEIEVRMKLADEIKYKHIKDNIVNTAVLYEMMNEKLNALEALKQLAAYQSILQDLNNPSSESLGFSYNDKVMQLIENELLVEKGKENSKILNFAKVILENPIAKGIGSIAPVVSTATSLLSFISGIGIERKDITEERILAFKQELERYTLYYARLNDANARFESNLVSYQSEVVQMQEKLQELSVLNANQMRLRIREKNDNETHGEYLLSVFQNYNKSATEYYFKNLEAQNPADNGLNHEMLLKESAVQDMYKRTEAAMLLFREFEKLYSHYLNIIQENNDTVITILEQAKDDKIGKSGKIKDQISKLEKEKNSTLVSVRTAINLGKMTRVAEKLSKFPPTI